MKASLAVGERLELDFVIGSPSTNASSLSGCRFNKGRLIRHRLEDVKGTEPDSPIKSLKAADSPSSAEAVFCGCHARKALKNSLSQGPVVFLMQK